MIDVKEPRGIENIEYSLACITGPIVTLDRADVRQLLDELESCRKCVKSHENLNENMQALNRTLLEERAKLLEVLKASDALLRFMRKYDKKKGVAIANALWIVDLCNSLERKIEACADIQIEEASDAK